MHQFSQPANQKWILINLKSKINQERNKIELYIFFDAMRPLNDTTYDMVTEIICQSKQINWFNKLILSLQKSINRYSFPPILWPVEHLLHYESWTWITYRNDLISAWKHLMSGMMSPMRTTWFPFLIEINERHYKTVCNVRNVWIIFRWSNTNNNNNQRERKREKTKKKRIFILDISLYASLTVFMYQSKWAYFFIFFVHIFV